MNGLAEVGWLATITGTVLAFLLGWFWYGPSGFGKGWAEGSGISLNTPDNVLWFPMLAQALALFLLALVIAILLGAGLPLAALLVILSTAAFCLCNGAWLGENRYALSVDTFYVIVSGLLMLGLQILF